MTIKPVYHDCYIFGLVIKKKMSLLRGDKHVCEGT